MSPSRLRRLGPLLWLLAPLLLFGETVQPPERGPSGLPSHTLPADHPCRLPDNGFVPFHEKDGVAIRTHELPGGRVVVRSVAEIPAPPEDVARFMSDVGGWSAWVKRLRSSERISGDSLAFHLAFDAPWPFSNRDYAIVPALDRDAEGNLVLWWESAADRLPPPRHGVVRVSEIRGGVVFLPGSREGTTRVVYSDVAVLGGKLPGWATRESYRRGPVGILGALRRHFSEEGTARGVSP